VGRLLLCGVCPLPFENTRQNYGPGIRTWQFATGLARAGQGVDLVAMVIPGVYGPGELLARESRDGIEIERLGYGEFMDPAEIRRRLASLRPDAVVGATVYGSFALAQAAPELPFWADQFGHVMAEAQAKAALEGENWPLAYFWRMVQEVVRRADRLSVVSERQRYAALGELGALGRLNAETCGHELISVMPCPLLSLDDGKLGRSAAGEPVIRGRRTPEDAFLVLWSGGYNTWSDVGTLARGLEGAMGRNPRVHFVSTGGAIEGQDTESYARFEALVASSAFRDRFHLAGWLPSEQVPRYTAEADLGVLTEKAIYEGLLGGKNRIAQWMGAGLPVAYNRVGDLGDLLATDELGLTFPPGDGAALAEAILWAAEHPAELREMATRAKRAARERFSIEATTRELAAWAAAPQRAPDAAVRSGIESPSDFGRLQEQLAVGARTRGWLRRLPLGRVLRRRLAGSPLRREGPAAGPGPRRSGGG
jgi:glycosyltransferase involved in cell wall biosynthesis